MIIIAAVIAFILGSIPSGYLIGKAWFNTDIRKLGSGNVGSTNALRSFGLKAGGLTFAIDILKGFLAVLIGEKLSGYNGMLICYISVVMGHMYSVFLNFKGGKGVATTFGGLLFIDYKYALILVVVFALVFLLSHIVSLASILSAITVFLASFFRYGFTSICWVMMFLSFMVIFRHRSNIDRLIHGQEKKLF